MDPELTHNILRTKLHRPPVSAEHVYRSRLIDFLLKNQYKPLTLISAPAGYGKSMLASSWMEKCKCITIWISLSKEINNLYTFLEYLRAGYSTTFPRALKTFSSLIYGPELPPVRVIADALLNDLDKINKDFVLVLDDYHLISDASIHELINLLLKYPPQEMHLVILTRKDPPLSLGSLRVYNRMNEIRMGDLAFTENETIDLYQQLLDTSISDESAAILNRKTEGWVVGLRMASISYKPTEDVDLFLTKLSGDSFAITEFLLEQVLERQPEEQLELLLITSILERFSAELVTEIYQDESAQTFVQWLIKSDLFIIPLDNTNDWFRYHHFFKDLLYKQLKQKYTSEKIALYHKRASSWFEKMTFYEEAIDHALKSDDMSRALGIFYTHRYELMNSEQWTRLSNMIQLYPEEVIESDPQILLTKGFIYDYRGRTELTLSLLEQIEKLTATVSRETPGYNSICGEYYTLLAQKQFYLLNEFEQAISSVKKAFDLYPDDAQYAKSFALYWYAFSLHMLGRIPESRKLISDALNDSSRFDNTTHARIYLISCVLNFLSGDLAESKDAADRCLLLGKEHKLHEAINLAYYFLGSIHFFRNELTETTKYFELLFNNRYTCRSTYAVIGSIILVLIHDARGLDKDARNMMDALHKFILDTDSLKHSEYFRALRTELALMQQDYELAVQIDDGKEYEVYKPMWFTFNPQLTSVKVSMYSQSSASAGFAENKLRALVEFGRSTYNTYFQIQAMALLALHLWRQGDEKNALGILNESLALASLGRFVRTYVLLGQEMRMILSKLSDNKEYRDFIHQILIAFENEALYAKKSSTKSLHKKLSTTGEHADIEPLSVREMDVLKLLAQGLRNKEIASGLHIATETVKVHLSKIFKKLRASSRIEAVNIAKTAGILEDL